MDARHFGSKRNSKSLSTKNAGPWQIIKNIANKAYKLDISQQMKDAGVTPVFHSWKLHLALNNAFLSQVLESKPVILIDSNNEEAHKE